MELKNKIWVAVTIFSVILLIIFRCFFLYSNEADKKSKTTEEIKGSGEVIEVAKYYWS